MPVVKYMVGTQVNAGRKMVPQNMGSQGCAGPGMCGAGNVRGRECAGPCTGSGRGGEGLADLAEDHYICEFR